MGRTDTYVAWVSVAGGSLTVAGIRLVSPPCRQLHLQRRRVGPAPNSLAGPGLVVLVAGGVVPRNGRPGIPAGCWRLRLVGLQSPWGQAPDNLAASRRGAQHVGRRRESPAIDVGPHAPRDSITVLVNVEVGALYAGDGPLGASPRAGTDTLHADRDVVALGVEVAQPSLHPPRGRHDGREHALLHLESSRPRAPRDSDERDALACLEQAANALLRPRVGEQRTLLRPRQGQSKRRERDSAPASAGEGCQRSRADPSWNPFTSWDRDFCSRTVPLRSGRESDSIQILGVPFRYPPPSTLCCG